MKKTFLALCLPILLAFIPGALTQSRATENAKDSLYIVVYTTGKNWDHNKSAYEQKYFEEHSKHLGRLMKEKVIKFGARYSDKGMIVVHAPDRERAMKILREDSIVRHGIFNAELDAFDVFYDGCTN